ncbi:MAG: response regulator [Gemmatimonadaceae bacterium]
MIRLLLADDHVVLKAGIRRLLADVPDFEVVAEASTGFEAVEGVRTHQIDVAIIDVGMPGPDIVTEIESIRSVSPGTRVVVLSAQPAERYAVRVLRAGASAYIMKQEAWTEVVAAIRKAHAGGRYVTPTLAEAMAETLGSAAMNKVELSGREMQVLQKMAAGLSPGDIADEMSVSPKTVHTYRARLLQKLGLRTNAELIRYALEHHYTD